MLYNAAKVRLHDDILSLLENEQRQFSFTELLEWCWENVNETRHQSRHVLWINVTSTLKQLVQEGKVIEAKQGKQHFYYYHG